MKVWLLHLYDSRGDHILTDVYYNYEEACKKQESYNSNNEEDLYGFTGTLAAEVESAIIK